MIRLKMAGTEDAEFAMKCINDAKRHLKQQGIDQWQKGYPDQACIEQDIRRGKGFLLEEEGFLLGYLCIDFDGEPAYEHLNGEWQNSGDYVVVHRMAFADEARGKGLAQTAFHLVEEYSLSKGVKNFRVDTDADNLKMKHILNKAGFEYRGTIWFDNSEKIAYEKKCESEEIKLCLKAEI